MDNNDDYFLIIINIVIDGIADLSSFNFIRNKTSKEYISNISVN